MIDRESPLTDLSVEAWIRERQGRRGANRFSYTMLGRSVLGHPIWAIRIGEGTPRGVLVATHHAMEDIAGKLLLLYGEVSMKRPCYGEVWMIPCLNPDGTRLRLCPDPASPLFERQIRMNGGSLDFSHWQANGRGVDLNHNYPTGFDAYRVLERQLEIPEGAPAKYSGCRPLSEPETACFLGFVESICPAYVLTLHTQGREMYLGGTKDMRVKMWAQLLARRVGYTVCEPEGTALYGGLTDHLATRGIPSITVECGVGENPLPPSCLSSLFREVSPLFTHAGRLWQMCSRAL